MQCNVPQDPGLDRLAAENIWGTTGTTWLLTGSSQHYRININSLNVIMVI